MIVAVSMFRDEADVAKAVVEHLLAEGVGLVIVADNLSSDSTRMQLDSIRGPVEILDDPDPAYWQAEKMTAMCRRAENYGADWVLPFDADEWWYSPQGSIAEALDDLDAEVVEAPGWDHVRTRNDEPGHPFASMVWRRPHPQSMPKVAFRPHHAMRLHQGNHFVDRPGRRVTGPLAFRHFQYRSLEQFARKVRTGKAAYDATDLPEVMGCHWRTFGAMSDRELCEEWDRMLDTPDLVLDPC